MLLHRSARGVLSASDSHVMLRAVSMINVIEPFPIEDFRTGALDATIIEALGVSALAEAAARDQLAKSGVTLASTRAEHAGRPHVQRKWGIGRDEQTQARITGRSVSVANPNVSYRATFEEHLADGFPADVAEELGGWASEITAAIQVLAPLPCFCHTGVESIGEHGAVIEITSKNDDRMRVSVARCTVCGQGWTFEAVSSEWVHEFLQSADFTEEELERVIAAIRDGERVAIGGGRSGTSYRAGADGGFIREDYEDNSGEEHAIDEAYVRWAIGNTPDNFLGILQKPLRAALRDALLDATTLEKRQLARKRLAELAYYGPVLAEAAFIDAVLAWPEEKPAPEALANLLQGKSGLDVFHVIMSAVGYDCKSRACGLFGVRFFDTVAAMMVGAEMRKWHRYRAGFRTFAGDAAGAIKDLEWERAHQSPGDPDAEYLARELAEAKTILARLSLN